MDFTGEPKHTFLLNNKTNQLTKQLRGTFSCCQADHRDDGFCQVVLKLSMSFFLLFLLLSEENFSSIVARKLRMFCQRQFPRSRLSLRLDVEGFNEHTCLFMSLLYKRGQFKRD